MANLAFDKNPPEQRLARLTELARHRLPPERPQPDAIQAAGYERLRLRMARESTGGGRLRFVYWSVGTLGVAAAAALVLVTQTNLRGPGEGALTAALETDSLQPITPGQELRAPAEAEAALRFSDGTNVTLAKSTRGRVASTSARGARVKIDQGRARVKVVHRKGGEWLFDAGPCQIHVTGTTFDMEWSEEKQQLEVLLYTGSVTVRGPPAPRGITLRDGQRLVMDLRENTARMHFLPTATPLPPSARPPTPEAAPAERPPAERPRPARVSVTPEPRRTWPALVAAGEFSAVVQDARRQGIDQSLGRSSANDVMALADAARFLGQGALARKALLAARSRFPDSPSHHKAAFLLGKLAEDMDGDLGKALEWYGLYLSNAPQGPQAADALGRKMTATLRLFGRASAKPIASEYLRRFPQGAYAEAARTITHAE